MIPTGYSAPNPKDNISINQATKYIAKAAKLGVVVGKLYIDPTGGGAQVNQLISTQQAIANGVTNDDPINLVDTKGNNIAQADALLKPATINNIITWFQETGNNNPANATLSALANLPAVQLAISNTIGD